MHSLIAMSVLPYLEQFVQAYSGHMTHRSCFVGIYGVWCVGVYVCLFSASCVSVVCFLPSLCMRRVLCVHVMQALKYGKFSTSSDVWSFGCVLYEMWSLGKTPMANVETSEVGSEEERGRGGRV